VAAVLANKDVCTGWAKLNGASAVSFFVVVKLTLENLIILAGEITVHFRTLRIIKIKYFSPEGATKANNFLCSSILAVLLTHNFYIKTILSTNNFYGKKSSAVASIYLLASIMYCNLFGATAICFFAKITCVVFRITTRLSLQISLSACIIGDDRRGAL